MPGCTAIIPLCPPCSPTPSGPSCCAEVRRRIQKFEVPDDEEREAALGSLTGAPFMISRVLTCARAWCEPIDIPCEEDWLSQHHETGQTFDAFRECFKQHRHKLAPTENQCTIHLLPVGNFGHCPQLLSSLE